MKTEIKLNNYDDYPIKVVIKLESKEDALRFLAATGYAANPDDEPHTFDERLAPYASKDQAMCTFDEMISWEVWTDLFEIVSPG